MDESSAALPAGTSIRDIPFEQRLYIRSPVGTLATTAVVFVFLAGSFLALAAFDHVATITSSAKGISISQIAWSAMVLALLCSSALGMQRYARLREAPERAAYAKILTGGMQSALNLTGPDVPDARLGRATVVGVIVGFILSAVIRVVETREGHPTAPGPMVWFIFATTLLSILFARGVEQSRAGNRAYSDILNAELKIDLLRIDTLSVLGRAAARTSLIWFVVSAVACLFFVGGDLNWLTIALIVSCGAMGIAMFVSVMSRVHRQIMAAKAAELEHIRRQIDTMRATMHADDHAAARMHGLLAYEKRVVDAQEWPFDQSTLVRVGASALILTVPWFGQAIAQYVVEHLSHG